jgi:cytochrome c553
MKKTSLILFILTSLSILLITSCDHQQKNKISAEEAKALTLMQTYCFACHTPDMGIDRRLGPPIFRIREHYYNDQISREEFMGKIVRFASNLTEANSIMPGAIRNFGLMPKQVFKKEDLEIIAGYIYDHDLSSDEWYAAWEKFKTEAKPEARAMTFEEKGLNIVNNTKSHLAKNLMEAMANYGPAGAVEFCNAHALTLTDSMARVQNARIRRVTDRPRNPANQANETELAYINMLKIKADRQEALPPTIMVLDGKMTGYYPIQTAKMCIQCHGMEDTDILPETLAKIKSLYPEDKATGYAEGQLRGLFVVEMD